MVSAASTTKRRTGIDSNGTKKKTAKGAAPAASAGPSKKSMQSSVKLAPQNASVSEKRRIAALISWEKRRAKVPGNDVSKAKPATTASKSKRKAPLAAIARPVTPPKDKKRVSIPSAKRRKMDADRPTSKSSKGAKAASGQGHQNVPSPRKAFDRSQAAKIGWERKRNKQAAQEIRRKAARLGWERRRSLVAADGGADGSSASPGVAAAADERPSSAAAAAVIDKKKAKAKAAAASSKAVGGYSVAARRKAAILGWEKRRNEKAARRVSSFSEDASSATRVPPQAAPSKPQPKKDASARKGSKRSRRLASFEDSDGAAVSHETETRRINELVTHLRLSRGWMEFHPSSRHGSGTATYGYIPSSIASFIRSGSISQRTVLDHGTLGVHYALDWHGYGGLKEMIDTFGEDFSPFPTEEMIEQARVPEWELGDDLPWREVEAAEERKRAEEKTLTLGEEHLSASAAANEDEDMEDILFVASILASLDENAAADTSAEEVLPSETRILTLQNYESSDEYNSDAKQCPLTHLADVAVEKECDTPFKSNIVEKDVLIVRTSRQDFKHWNFGLS